MNDELSKNVVLDDAADVVTIYGTPMSGDLLRAICVPSRPGEWFRIVKRDGVATVEWKLDLGWFRRVMLGSIARIRTPLLRK